MLMHDPMVTVRGSRYGSDAVGWRNALVALIGRTVLSASDRPDGILLVLSDDADLFISKQVDPGSCEMAQWVPANERGELLISDAMYWLTDVPCPHGGG